MVYGSAENGCFVKSTPTRAQPHPEWINMVANFNMTWKHSCIEILGYVSLIARLL
jgi:trehalose 6-phosphate synthase/phosphatase